MSDLPQQPAVEPTVRNAQRASGIAAVLLVVLLATSGWPSEAQTLVDNTQVTSCESTKAEVGRVASGSSPCVFAEVVRLRTDAPRVRPRAQRVDSWGRPPARAPTV